MHESWKPFYVSYASLKAFVVDDGDVVRREVLELTAASTADFADSFLFAVNAEVERADKHFVAVLDELWRHVDTHEFFFNMAVAAPHGGRSKTPLETRVPPQEPSTISPITPLKGFGSFAARTEEHAQKNARDHSLAIISAAHALQRFTELNSEAIRKAAKKAEKHCHGLKVSRRAQDRFEASEMHARRDELDGLVKRIADDFRIKYHDELEQFRDGKMAVGEHWHAQWRWVAFSVALFAITMNLPILQENDAARRCLALFVGVIALWTTEAVPFFVTAMLIPIVAVPLGILADPVTGRPAEANVAARVMMGRIFDHVQILVLGGLTMAKAVSKVQLEGVFIDFLHSRLAHRPAYFMLGIMLLACVLCAFVSNVASPVLVLGVLQHTLWEMPRESKAPHAIILGVAIACNLGGMLSPMASPQNAVALQVLAFTHNMTFLEWILLATPLVLITLVVAWVVLLKVYDPFKDLKFIPIHVAHKQGAERDKRSTVVVVSTCCVTVILWCLPSTPFGDTGIVALIPVVVFYGVGILKKDDFNALSWHLLFLLAGGNMLGTCTRDSRLLDLVTAFLQSHLDKLSPFAVYCVVISVVGVVTTFISHTVAAILLLPVIAKVGLSLTADSSVDPTLISASLLVFASVLMCSGAMAFPITSFPNVNSLLTEDDKGVPYLTARDFAVPGSVATLCCYLGLITYMVPLMSWLL